MRTYIGANAGDEQPRSEGIHKSDRDMSNIILVSCSG
jgi:hypothetical protein